MRQYCIGAMLLDLENPARVIARLDEPLLAHKYRLVISDSRTLKSQSLEIEVTDRKLTTRTITFDGR